MRQTKIKQKIFLKIKSSRALLKKSRNLGFSGFILYNAFFNSVVVNFIRRFCRVAHHFSLNGSDPVFFLMARSIFHTYITE